MPFTLIEGHDGPIKVLTRAMENKSLAHAYLFSGEAGIGKKMCALELAAAVNCGNAGPTGSCGTCAACRRIAGYLHPDIHVVMPESQDEMLRSTLSSKEIEKASDVIKIDQIRRAQESIVLTPSEGGRKVLIVDGAETLNVEAQNAFLKTLEEPPGNCLIILIAARPQSLLLTIRSRCQEIKFHPLSRGMLAQALMRRRNLAEEDAWFLAALAQGSLGRGLMMEVEQEKAERDKVMTLWSGLRAMRHAEVLVHAETLTKDHARFDRLLEIGVEWLRDALVYRETGEEQILVNGKARVQYEEWGARDGVPRMLADLDLFVASRGLLDRRVSAQLVAENLLFKLGRS